jgi:hypothetical protein
MHHVLCRFFICLICALSRFGRDSGKTVSSAFASIDQDFYALQCTIIRD